jgi:hypothetical protein
MIRIGSVNTICLLVVDYRVDFGFGVENCTYYVGLGWVVSVFRKQFLNF